MSPEVGDIIDRYRVDEVIGHGGMAVVYRVTHTKLGSEHALKVLTLNSAAIKRRLLQEGQAQARLRHPNIVSVTDVIDVEGSPGLIMELIEGPTLEEFQRRDPLTLRQVDAVAAGILAGVAEAHAQGLIHRDIKPSNVMLDRTSSGLVPKICDFGLVKVLETERSLSRTKAGVTMGTPRYMSPEQIRDAKNVDERADVFSLGALLYEMATREQAFPGDDPIALFKAIDSGLIRPPRALVPELPERMERAILGALQRDKEERIQSVPELLAIWTGKSSGAYQDARNQLDTRALEVPKTQATMGGGAPSVSAPDETAAQSVPVPVPSPAPAPSPPPSPPTQVPTDTEQQAQVQGVQLGRDDPPSLTPEREIAVAPDRTPLVLGVVAALLLVGGLVWLTMSGGGAPPVETVEPRSEAAPPAVTADPAPEAEAPPEDQAVASVVEPSAVPTAAPARAASPPPAAAPSTAPAAAPASAAPPAPAPSAAPAPAPAAPAPEAAAPEPEAAPPPAPAATTAQVRVSGARKVVLEQGSQRYQAGEVPPGTYQLTVFFEGVEPVTVGEITLSAGEDRLLRCSASLRRCN